MMQVNRVVPQSVFNNQCLAIQRFLNGPDASNHVWQHQIDAVIRVFEQLQNLQMPNIALVVLPTGCGKTGVAVLAAYALNASRVLVITPSVKISKQIHEAFCGSQTRRCFLEERGICEPADVLLVVPRGECITDSAKIRQHYFDHFMVVNAHKIGGLSSVKIEDIPSDGYDLVIVDEAHHYPAPTWKMLVDHFDQSRRIFITATPEYKGKPILPHAPCFTLPREVAIRSGIIRNIEFYEVPNQQGVYGPQPSFQELQEVAQCVRQVLDAHDQLDPDVKHQAMVMAQTVQDLNSAYDFKNAYGAVTIPGDTCEMYVTNTPREVLDGFDRGEIRTLVIVGKLLEGYDNKRVSVVAIVRNVARQSKVLFTQFVGRAVRKVRPNDPVTAMIISHQKFNQRVNFDQFDTVTDEENSDHEYYYN